MHSPWFQPRERNAYMVNHVQRAQFHNVSPWLKPRAIFIMKKLNLLNQQNLQAKKK